MGVVSVLSQYLQRLENARHIADAQGMPAEMSPLNQYHSNCLLSFFVFLLSISPHVEWWYVLRKLMWFKNPSAALLPCVILPTLAKAQALKTNQTFIFLYILFMLQDVGPWPAFMWQLPIWMLNRQRWCSLITVLEMIGNKLALRL